MIRAGRRGDLRSCDMRGITKQRCQHRIAILNYTWIVTTLFAEFWNPIISCPEGTHPKPIVKKR